MELIPLNNYLVIDVIKQDSDKIGNGILFAPGNMSESPFKVAKVVFVDEDIKQIKKGDIILVDTLGSHTHRVGIKSFQTVKYNCVIAIIKSQFE